MTPSLYLSRSARAVILSEARGTRASEGSACAQPRRGTRASEGSACAQPRGGTRASEGSACAQPRGGTHASEGSAYAQPRRGTCASEGSAYAHHGAPSPDRGITDYRGLVGGSPTGDVVRSSGRTVRIRVRPFG